ncbi:hypothetical protein [Aquabacterium sp.]|uniref:hypothetical protein n=1 Tax=Aquabacterium sp. TaxID=1872578 RepID=UPI002BCC0AC9|nr:hypothetical protein [Aquabacterium sp.]HSW06956.1 hypothetical protein [Aquabacterium sp.]
MKHSWARRSARASLSLLSAATLAAAAQGNGMSFFITSNGLGNGADLGGLAGADKHCQALAKTAGAGSRTWRAYLSTTASAGAPALHARERIGTGPWQNAKGQVIAKDLEQLHGENSLNKETALTEKGDVVPGYGDTPNRRNILTGSTPEGRAFDGQSDTTCGNWTRSENEGAAVVGRHDRSGGDRHQKSWNSSRMSRGCSQWLLRQEGGDGLFYCFAAD